MTDRNEILVLSDLEIGNASNDISYENKINVLFNELYETQKNKNKNELLTLYGIVIYESIFDNRIYETKNNNVNFLKKNQNSNNTTQNYIQQFLNILIQCMDIGVKIWFVQGLFQSNVCVCVCVCVLLKRYNCKCQIELLFILLSYVSDNNICALKKKMDDCLEMKM